MQLSPPPNPFPPLAGIRFVSDVNYIRAELIDYSTSTIPTICFDDSDVNLRLNLPFYLQSELQDLGTLTFNLEDPNSCIINKINL